MFLHDAPITIKEAMSPHDHSPTLATVFRSILSFLEGRPDAVVFGAHAVNAYVDPPRMTADVDIMSTDAEDFANELRDQLAEQFHIAVRVREVARGSGFRIYQLRKLPEKNRHLVDVRQVAELPPAQRVDGVCVIDPEELIVMKLESFVARRHTDKGISDRLDLHRMLLAFPEFRLPTSEVFFLLQGAPANVRDAWREILSEPISHSNDDEY